MATIIPKAHATKILQRFHDEEGRYGDEKKNNTKKDLKKILLGQCKGRHQTVLQNIG